MTKEAMFVSFSGGRTSAYMCWWLLNNKSHEYNFVFVFANTGLEHEKTLEFVDKCDREWGLNLAWLEADVMPEKGAEIIYKQVDFGNASRAGEPFYDICAKHGVPNTDRPFCTQYLKTYVINAYKASKGFARSHLTAIGIRADEFDRMNEKQLASGAVCYPLIKWKHSTKEDILMFFTDNSFDLELDERLGNCVTCFKKSDRHLMTIAKMDSRHFDFMAKAEQYFGHIDAKDGDPYRFFRGNKTVDNIIASSEQPFREFDPTMKEYQLGFDLDDLDIADDCGANSCEAA